MTSMMMITLRYPGGGRLGQVWKGANGAITTAVKARHRRQRRLDINDIHTAHFPINWLPLAR